MERPHFIYGLFEPKTNHIKYIGETSNPKDRFRRHLNGHYSQKSKTKCSQWILDLKQGGVKPGFKILEECSFEERHKMEMFYIAYLKSLGCDLLNQSEGGRGPNGAKRSDEWKAKLSAYMKAHPVSKEQREKMYLARKLNGKFAPNKGRKFSPEWRANISAAKKLQYAQKRAQKNV